MAKTGQKPSKPQNYRTFEILGVKVDFINLKTALNQVGVWLESNKTYQITTPNPEHIILAQTDYRLKKIINNSGLAVADGIGLVWAARLLGRAAELKAGCQSAFGRTKLEKLAGVDLMLGLCCWAVEKNWRVFLLGGRPGIAKAAAQTIQQKTTDSTNGRLKIDYYAGSQNISQASKRDQRQIVERINRFEPDLLFVAFGAPQQEYWLAENLARLKVGVGMGVGGSFDYLAGRPKRAPLIVRKAGLEWSWRLLVQPWRWSRQLRLIRFIILVIKARVSGNKNKIS